MNAYRPKTNFVSTKRVHRVALTYFVAALGITLGGAIGCDSGDTETNNASFGGSSSGGQNNGAAGSGANGGTGAQGGSGGSTGGGGSGTGGSQSGGSAGTSTAGTSGSSGTAGSAGSAATAGTGGSGGSGAGWPECNEQPAGVPAKTIHDLWADNPTEPTPVWISGVYVTGVSYGGCSPGFACEIYLQQDESYADTTAGAHQAIKFFVSGNTAEHFLQVHVGEKVDVYGYAWRYNVSGQNELLVQVNLQFPGCLKSTDVGNPIPTPATLDELSVDAYENTLGPLLISLSNVSGTPKPSTSGFFALWDTATGPMGGIETVTNLSPYYLSGGNFDGLVADQVHDFSSVSGVFALFVPDNGTPKYEIIGPRTMDEVVVTTVHPPTP